jgi:NAD(P)-dependent dehydrogenase (short-subunit alcohol dehydrogenase family)
VGPLAGATCVVTGAAGGIGRACAQALIAQGGRVAVLDRDAAGAAAVARELGADALAVGCDVSDPASVASAAAAVGAALGPARVLVNAAGVLAPGGLAGLALEDWNRLLAVNLTGALLCSQAFGAGMRAAGGGALVHVASIAGSLPVPNAGAYAVAKAGLVMLSRQLALEWAGDGVRSNTVSPGLIDTAMTQAFHAAPGVAAARAALIPRGRIGTPQDVASVVAFLAGPGADYVTGQDLTVDGGLGGILMGMLPRPGFERAT